MAHYDSPFAVGWELERQREGWDGGFGVGVYEEERQLTPNGEKRAISNQVPSATQLATGQNTSVIRFLLTISPNLCAQCCPSATGMRTTKGVFRAALVALQLHLIYKLQALLIRISTLRKATTEERV